METNLWKNRLNVRFDKFLIVILFFTIISLRLSSQSAGDFQTVANGDWTEITSWQTYEDASWKAATAYPTSSDGVITIKHKINVNADISVDQLVINKQIIIKTGNTLTIVDGTGTDLTVNKNLILYNNANIVVTGTIVFNSGSLYQLKYTTSAGMIPTASWDANSTCEIRSYTSNTNKPSGLNQVFGNFKWNCPSQKKEIDLGGDISTINGSFTVKTTKTGLIKLGGNISLPASKTFSVNLASTVDMETYVVNFSGAGGTFDIDGTLKTSNSSGLSGTASTTFSSTNSPTVTLTNSTIEYNASSTQKITDATTYNNIVLSGSGTKTLDGAFSINNLTIGASCTLADDGNTLTVNSGGAITNNGTHSGTGKILIDDATISGGIFGNLENTGSSGATLNSNTTISGNITGKYIGTSKVILSGGSAIHTINGTFYDLELNDSNGATLNNSTTVNGTLTLTNGSFTVSSYDLYLNKPIAGTGTLSCSNSSTLRITGSDAGINIPSNVSTLSNLIIDNANGASLQSDLTIENTLTLTNGALTVGTNTLTIKNAISIGSGTLSTDNTSSIAILGSGSGIILPNSITNLNNFTLNNTNGTTLKANLTINGNANLEGGSLNLGTYNLIIKGNWNNTGGSVTANSQSVTFNGTSAQTISGTNTFYDLIINNSAGVSASGSTLTVSNLLNCQAGTFTSASDYADLTINNGSTLSLSNNITVSGNWILNTGGTFTHNNYKVTFDGAANQSIGGTAETAFHNFEINNANGASLGQNITINNVLTFTSGLVTLGTNNLTLGESASISGTFSSSNMVIADGGGELRKNFTSTGSFTFPVGDNTSTIEYSPITLNFTSGTMSGYAAVKVIDAKSPDNNSPTNYLTRYWTVTQSGLSGFSCDITASYLAADINGTESKIYFGKYNAGWTIENQALGNQITGTVTSFSTITGIDGEPPKVTSVTPSPTIITDSEAGGNNFTIAVLYNELMNNTVNPTIQFLTDGENPSSAITFVSGAWSNGDKTYTATYSVTDCDTDCDTDMSNVDVDISGAKNEIGNTQTAYDADNNFSYKFSNPTVTGVSYNVSPIVDATVGTGKFSLIVDFSEAMNTGISPVILFPSEDPSTTISTHSNSWSNGNKTFTLNYTVIDVEMKLADIDIRVTTAQDINGNLVTQYNEADKFSIDMENPVVTSITPYILNIGDGNIGNNTFKLTIVYNKVMKNTPLPTISFPVESPTNTLKNVSGTWTSPTTYVATYDVVEANEEIANIDVRVVGAKDLSDKTQTQKDDANKFSIDTKNPTVSSVIANLSLIIDNNIGANKFTLTVVYNEAMNTGVSPIISFSDGVLGSTIIFASDLWSNSTTYIATYNVADANKNISDVDVQVTGGTDMNNNTANTYDIADKFSIDTENPTATAPANTAQILKANDVSTSTIQTNQTGNIYLILNGETASTQTEIDAAVSAYKGFVGKSSATANTPYTIPVFSGINEGVYNIVAVDANQNVSSILSGWLTVDNTPPVTSAPIGNNQTLKSTVASTSTVRSNKDGKIYLVKNGIAATNMTQINAAMTANNAFLAVNSATSNTPYTITVHSISQNDGVYDIVAVDIAGNISNPFAGWLTVDNSAPTFTAVSTPTTESNGINADGKSKVTITWIDGTDASTLHYKIVAKEGSTPAISDVLAGFDNISQGTQTATFEWTSNKNLYIGVVAVDIAGNKKLTMHATPNVTTYNDAPKFSSTPVLKGKEDEVYLYDITGIDSDNVLTYANVSAVSKPAWLVLLNEGPGLARLKGTPKNPPGFDANNTIVLSINDGTTVVEQSFTIAVSDAFHVALLKVPGIDYTTIQGALDNATDGDDIYLHDAKYYGNLVFPDKNIRIIGNTADPTKVIINGEKSGSAITFENITKTIELKGVTVENGSGSIKDHSTDGLHSQRGNYGGGIYCYNASPILDKIIIKDNTLELDTYVGGSGAGIYVGGNSNITITNSTIQGNNSKTYRGGGICVDNSTITLNNVQIKENKTGHYGAGIASFNSTLNLTNTTITENKASGVNGIGGGMFLLRTIHNFNNVSSSTNTATVSGNGIFSFGTSSIIIGAPNDIKDSYKKID